MSDNGCRESCFYRKEPLMQLEIEPLTVSSWCGANSACVWCLRSPYLWTNPLCMVCLQVLDFDGI